MGYNGRNRRGLPQKGSGFSKSSINTGNKVFGRSIGCLGMLLKSLFGPIGVIWFFMAIINLKTTLLITLSLGVFFLFLYIIALIIRRDEFHDNNNDLLKNNRAQNRSAPPIPFSLTDVCDPEDDNNDFETRICSLLSKLDKSPNPSKRFARKYIQMGSNVKRKCDGSILYVITVKNGIYKCYDFDKHVCIPYTREDFVTD